MKNEIKVIFVDIDWTILDHNIKEFDWQSIEALRKAKELGIKIVISTSRPYNSAELTGIFDLLKPDGIICCNGGVVWLDNKLIYQRVFEPSLIRSICKMCDEFDINMELSTSNQRYLIHEGTPFLKEFYAIHGDVIPEQRNYNGEDICHISVYGGEDIDPILEKYLPKEMIKFRYFGTGVDLYFKRSSKGEGVLKSLNYYNIEPKYAMAIGDSDDDAEMFEVVKYGVAMGNGCDNAKEKAYYITSSVSEHGVCQALKEIIGL